MYSARLTLRGGRKIPLSLLGAYVRVPFQTNLAFMSSLQDPQNKGNLEERGNNDQKVEEKKKQEEWLEEGGIGDHEMATNVHSHEPQKKKK